jgi:DNA-binding NarL/FixJ family response regulator
VSGDPVAVNGPGTAGVSGERVGSAEVGGERMGAADVSGADGGEAVSGRTVREEDAGHDAGNGDEVSGDAVGDDAVSGGATSDDAVGKGVGGADAGGGGGDGRGEGGGAVIRVVVVDDEPMVCGFLRTILGSAGDIEVVEEAHDGAAGAEAVMRARPDVVLMDLRMPGVDGLTTIRRINALADPPVVIVLTTFDADQYVLRALRAGAAGFLVKSTPPGELIGLVRVAAQGHTVLSASAARRLVAASTEGRSNRDQARKLVESLTEREREVLAGLGEGLSNAQIASRLFLAEATVKGYVSRTLDKLGCANRTQAGLVAHDAGVVS